MKSFGGVFDISSKEERVKEIDSISQDPDFWTNSSNASRLMIERGELSELIGRFHLQEERYSDAEVFIELSAHEEADEVISAAISELDQMKKESMFNGEHDSLNAFVSINSGAGGADSQDLVEKMLRMYLRFSLSNGWRVVEIDRTPGSEAGIKSVDLHIIGSRAFGWLKSESGVHRFVRISPFGKGKRETSCVAVSVTPELADSFDVEILAKDLRIDTYRSGGPGGQHANKTDSAVRITHIPSGLVVQCQNEKSQAQNKETAIKMLKSRLFEAENKLREDQANELYKNKDPIEFGSQVRNYVFNPYTQVKDLRTGYTTSNITSILDGNLEEMILGNFGKEDK